MKTKPGMQPAVSSSPGTTIPLSAMHTGERGIVVELAAGHGLMSRMASLGFTPGAIVTVLQNYGHGPLIALVRDARIALGRGEAGRIHVRRSSEIPL